MAEHGDNYKRMKADDGSEIGKLGPHCGHHCGIITVGGNDQHIGHCPCEECHAGPFRLVPNTGIVRIGNTGTVPHVS